MHTQTKTGTCAQIHGSTQRRMHTETQKHAETYAQTDTHTSIDTHTHTEAHSYMDTHRFNYVILKYSEVKGKYGNSTKI